MTPARQPHPHPHEKCHECPVFFKCEQLPPCATHTIAPAPERNELAERECAINNCMRKDWLKQHDAQVAKAAREQVLKQLLYDIDGETGFYVFPHHKATTGNGLSRFVLLDDLTALVESLRAQQQEGGR